MHLGEKSVLRELLKIPHYVSRIMNFADDLDFPRSVVCYFDALHQVFLSLFFFILTVPFPLKYLFLHAASGRFFLQP